MSEKVNVMGNKMLVVGGTDKIIEPGNNSYALPKRFQAAGNNPSIIKKVILYSKIISNSFSSKKSDVKNDSSISMLLKSASSKK